MSPVHYKNSFLPYSLIFHPSSSLYTCYNVQMCTFVYRCIHIISYSLQMRDKMCFPFTAVRHHLHFLSLSIVLQMRNFIFLESRVGFHIYIYLQYIFVIHSTVAEQHSFQIGLWYHKYVSNKHGSVDISKAKFGGFSVYVQTRNCLVLW